MNQNEVMKRYFKEFGIAMGFYVVTVIASTTILNNFGIAIRSGHHCAQIMMEKLDVSATSRASFYLYNTKEEINIFINALDEAIKLFRL